MARNEPISTLFRPHQRYVRSIHLERDFDDASALQDYVVTDTIGEIIERVLKSIVQGGRQRAWRLTGDYGSGKSSLALALAHILAREPRQLPPKLRSFATRKRTGLGETRMLPVLLTGSRESLSRALLRRLTERLDELSPKGREPAVVRNARALLEEPHPEQLDSQVIHIVEQAMAYLQKTGRAAGLFLVLDELGKFLEYALLHPARQDVYFLQQLAELSERSDDFPLIVVGVLHQGFSAYAARSSVATQKEWEKVAGRYEEIVFRQSLDQTMTLAGSALGTQVESLPAATHTRCTVDFKKTVKLGWYGNVAPGMESVEPLSVFPLHPSAFPVLIRLFQRFGQNERSLFSFLFSNEPAGLQQFAAITTDPQAFYRIHHIYDYIKANLGYRLLHEPGSRWSLLESLVESYGPEESDDELLVLKTVAVLNLLDSQGLLAIETALHLALAESRARIDRALEILTGKRRILYARGTMGGYCLWPYTSIDIVDCYRRAEQELGPLEQLAPYAKRVLETRPIVARRHYIETGNLRYFAVHYTLVDELQATLNGLDEESDGHIVVALCENYEERQEAVAIARKYDAGDAGERQEAVSNVLIAVPEPLQPLASLFQEARCWEWVRANVPELGQDRFAEREVSRLLEEARRHMHATVNDRLGLRQGNRSMDITWYRGGKVQEVERGRDFLSLLSNICNEAYDKGPKIHNELINRAQLSSAAAAARMRLIERIFKHAQEPLLGMDPDRKPPEMSMYLSVLQHANLHDKNSKGEWVFRVPSPTKDQCQLRFSLTHITDLLKAAKEKRVSISDIAAELRKRPYGVRDGLIPLFIAVVCAIDEHHIAMYEDGSFVRKISGEEFYRMLKFPHQFELQYFKISGVRSTLFHQLVQVLDPDCDTHQGGLNILDVVRPLLEFVGRLPQYTLRTRRLSPEAIAVRNVLVAAREPAPLIFRDLPEACGVEPFAAGRSKEDKEHIEAFVDKLRSVLSELRAAYPELLTRMRKQVSTAFDLQGAFARVREKLSQRGERAGFVMREPRLKGFCMRLVDRGLAEQPWLEALGSYLCAKPPGSWFDADADRFADELAVLVERFCSAENLAFGQQGGNGHKPEEAVRVSLMQPDGTQVEQVITVSSDNLDKVEKLEAKIIELLDSEEHKRVGLAAISRALWKALQGNQEAGRQRAAKRK